MTYCSLDDVKARLSIDPSDTSYDQELQDLIAEAQTIIDEKLEAELGQVPFDESNVPDIIRYACADIAAGLFRTRREPKAKDAFYELGIEKLGYYIQSQGRILT